MLRKSWLERSLEALVQQVRNLKTKAPNYGTELPLSAAELSRIDAICSQIIAAYEYAENSKITQEAVIAWRNQVFRNGTPGIAMGKPPGFEVPPSMDFTQAAIVELSRIRDGILLKPGYTLAIGEDLRLVGAEQHRTPVEDLVPSMTIRTFAGYEVELRGKMQGMEGLIVEYATGADPYRQVAYLTNSPARVYIEPKVPNTAEKGRIRVKYMHKNQPVGSFSNVYPVTIS